MIDRTDEFLAATVATERLYRDLAQVRDRVVARVETLEETVRLLTNILDVLMEQPV